VILRKWSILDRATPTLLGKAATVMQFAFLLAVLWFGESVLAVLVATAVVSGLAAIDYLRLVATPEGGMRAPGPAVDAPLAGVNTPAEGPPGP
jgi:hypothetical protein